MGTGSERSEVPVPFYSELTNSGQAMGTADYMAPEQASDSHAVDIRADIYSLGCTLYKLLAGSAPFEGSQYKGTFEKMTAHVQQSAPPIENLLPEIPRELAAILEKMLAKNPADRFAQPADVIEALTPFCTNAALPALLVRAEEARTLHSDKENPNNSPLSLRERARVRADQARMQAISHITANPPPPSILVAIGLLLFALGFGLGYSFGILVTIKKDGKTTTFEAPEGSNVNVNDKGNVTVDLSAGEHKETIGAGDYKIAPGDILYITLKDPFIAGFIDGNLEVDQSGLIDLSHAEIQQMGNEEKTIFRHFKNLSPIKVKGLSLDEAAQAIEQHVGNVFHSPQLMLTLDRKKNFNNIDLSATDGKAAIPPEPYTIMPGDSLVIRVVGTISDQPIDGIYVVEPAGTVPMGPAYGTSQRQRTIVGRGRGCDCKKIERDSASA